MISQRAASEVLEDGTSQSESEPSEEINDDWLNAFEVEARQKSSEEMQVLFSKILAGEIRKPGSYSTRTVRILSGLDPNIASHFRRLCSISISSLSDVRVPSLGGDPGANALQEYGLNFNTLNLLNEHGLIIASYNSYYDQVFCISVPLGNQQLVCIPFNHQGMHWILIPKSKDGIGKMLRIHGIALTQSGSELLIYCRTRTSGSLFTGIGKLL